MVLTGQAIRDNVKYGIITIEPFDEKRVNPNSYNLRIGDKLMVYKNNELDMAKPNDVEIITIPKEGYVLQPGKLYLAQTMERTSTNEYIPMIEGRSSIGRLGLFVHITAGFGDIGFSGYWTLELSCIQPIRIYPEVEICQIYFHTYTGLRGELYDGGKYQNNEGIQPSMLWQEFDNE